MADGFLVVDMLTPEQAILSTIWRDERGILHFASEPMAETADGSSDVDMLTPEHAVSATLGGEINGETSDGYHTFNELYHHRAVLFSVIVRDHKEIAWKARRHHDGTMYDGMFIVGIETPKGQATYHYDIDPYWDMFDCEEREFAPEWDGHTPDEAIARIAALNTRAERTCRMEQMPECMHDDIECSECGVALWAFSMDIEGEGILTMPNYCPNCGAKVVSE